MGLYKKNALSQPFRWFSSLILMGLVVGGSIGLGVESPKLSNFTVQSSGHRSALDSLATTATPSTPISRNQLMANVLAQTYQNIYVPIHCETIAYLKISEASFYSANLTNTQWDNQRSLLTFILAYMKANPNVAIESNPKMAASLTPTSMLQNFNLDFAQGIYETAQRIIEVPVAWGNGDAVGDSVTDLSIFFDPQTSAIANNLANRAQAQLVVNQIATTFPTISVQSAQLLPEMMANSFIDYPNTSSTMVAKNQLLLLTFLAQYIQVHLSESLSTMLSGTNLMDYLQIQFSNPHNFAFSVGQGTVVFYLCWGNTHWQPVVSTSTITLTGFNTSN